MEKIVKLLIVLLSINIASAQNICDSSCEIRFIFESGGSIFASEPMTFTFLPGSELNLGETGTINSATQPASLDFSEGGELILAAGESITFDVDGFLSVLGNLDTTNFSVITGDLIIISEDGDVTVPGDVSISEGHLTIFNYPQNVTISGNVNVDGTIFIDSRTLTQLPDASITADSFESMGIDVDLIEPSDDLSLLDGLELKTADGTPCLVTGNECIADNGDVYVLQNGNLVKQGTGSGSLGFGLLLILLLNFRFFQTLSFKVSKF